MKKLLLAFMTLGLIISASSCKKCGYCQYGGGNGNGSAVCQSSSVVPGITSDYNQAKADCSAQGGVWVLTK